MAGRPSSLNRLRARAASASCPSSQAPPQNHPHTLEREEGMRRRRGGLAPTSFHSASPDDSVQAALHGAARRRAWLYQHGRRRHGRGEPHRSPPVVIWWSIERSAMPEQNDEPMACGGKEEVAAAAGDHGGCGPAVVGDARLRRRARVAP